MEQIKVYLKSEGLDDGAIQRRIAELMRHADIAAEFEAWVQGGAGAYLDGVIVEGYTARRIKELAPFMNGAGVYSFLVTLREKPERAKEYIAEGFPIG